MDLARINFSHGSHRENGRIVRMLKDAEIPIICDIQGPKIRVGEMPEKVVLERGSTVTLTTRDATGNGDLVPVSYKWLTRDLKKGDMVFIGDGIISLEALEVEDTEVRCRVISGGLLSSRQGVNLPNIELTERVPTKKDLKDLEYIADLDPEYVAVSFVSGGEDVERVREVLGRDDIGLISKIERQVAVEAFEEILKVSEGIMVARGDLGVETPPERVPGLQKEMIRKCNREGKPVIVATQMLESMIFHPVPTRAEASDVFNAVLDGADALMLSGETAIGRYPVEAVDTMARIAASAEATVSKRDPGDYHSGDGTTISEMLGHSAYIIVEEFGLPGRKVILSITRTGHSARMISKYRPPAPILAATPSGKLYGQLALLWGVRPIRFSAEEGEPTDELMRKAVEKGVEEGRLGPEDQVIIVCAASLVPRKTNILGVFRVGEVMG